MGDWVQREGGHFYLVAGGPVGFMRQMPNRSFECYDLQQDEQNRDQGLWAPLRFGCYDTLENAKEQMEKRF